MPYENPYKENPDPEMERFEKNQAEKAYWKNEKKKKAMSELDFDKLSSAKEKFRAIKEKYLS